ncbi:hypothetical protein [Parabacteroides johnsonii]|uniref:hypothetical protein n=1 Tax=Parabacteroides johnsonii TaxID=387661 RepID=UPI00307E082D
MLIQLADFVTFVLQNETKMEKHRSIIVFGGILILTILVVFLSYRYVISVKNIEIQRTFYLFKQSVEQEKVLMQPEQMFLGDLKTELRSDSVIIETEKGKVKYKKNKQEDSLTLPDKREWFFQMFIAFKNSNRAFTLDSLFQEELKSEGIIAQTAVSFSQGDSLVSCSNKPLSQAGIALEPIVFGVEHDQRQIKLQAYVLFSHSYLFSRMPLIWGLILLWCILVIIMYIWQRRKKVEHNKTVVTPVTPVPAVLSSDASEWIEIAQDVFFCKKTGELKDRDHKVFLARNRLRAFICFWEAPDHTVSYPVFCNDVLGRPLSEDESTEENRQLNRAIKKSMTQTIMRLREDLTTFPELSIENASGLSYRLNIGTVRESNVGLSECESDVL